MQTRREALVAVGMAKPGRGKFSKDAVAWLAAQRAKGVKFSDDDAPVKPVNAKKETRTDETPAPTYNPANTAWLSPRDYRFPEGEYRALGTKDGQTKEYSLREACNRCRVSLVNHECDTPTILGDVQIKIVKKKG
jgi:hypothetical protein